MISIQDDDAVGKQGQGLLKAFRDFAELFPVFIKAFFEGVQAPENLFPGAIGSVSG